MGSVGTPMFLAERAMPLSAMSLRDLVAKADHLLLGRVGRICGIFSPISNLVGRIGLFDALENFKEFSDTLGYQSSTELGLVLQVLRNHSKDVTG